MKIWQIKHHKVHQNTIYLVKNYIKVIDGFGPDGISGVIKKFSIKANKFQSGYIYQYAFIMLLGFSAFLTFLIVK